MSRLKSWAPTVDDAHLLIRITLAGTLAWWLSTLLGQDRPLFAALVPLVAMMGDPYAAFNVSLSRVLGVFLGVLLGIGLINLQISSSTATVAVLFATSLAVGLAIRIGGQPNNQIGISALFMVYVGEVTRAETIGFARVWETALGAGVSLAVAALMWPPDPLSETRRRLRRLTEWTHDDLIATAEVLEQRDADQAEELLDEVRERSRDAVRYVLELDRGERALRINPRRRKDGQLFAVERTRMMLAARTYRHARTLARYVVDAVVQGGPVEGAPLADGIRLLADAAVQTLGPDPAPAQAQLADMLAELDRFSAESPHDHGISAKLRQIAADLSAGAAQAESPALTHAL